MVAISGLKIIKNFSLVHRLQLLVTGLKGLARLTIFQPISYCMFWSSSSQIYFESFVEFLGFLVLKLDLWFLHLSLKLVAVNPM